MKKKGIAILSAASLAVVGLGIACASAFKNGGLVFKGKASNPGGNIVFTAADFGAASGDFAKGGVNWHYEGASVDGNTVTMKKIYNTSAAGSVVNEDAFTRGAGFDSVSFENYSESADFSGGAIYSFGFDRTEIKGRSLASYVDLSVAQADSNYRRIIEITEGTGSFSFTSLTIAYGCEEVAPEISFNAASYTIEETVTETVSATGRYLREAATYSFSAADNTVVDIQQVGATASAEVTGLKTGSTTITVTMTTGGNNYTDTVNVTVIEGRPNIFHSVDNANVPSQGEGDIQNNQLRIYMGNGASSASISDGVITINHKGGEWWASQVFFRDAYFNMNNEYKVSFTFNASSAGKIQLSNSQYDVVVGNNKITRTGKPHNNLSTMSLQLGADGVGCLADGTYTISNIVINDLTNERYNITFNNEGATNVIEGCAGKKLWTIPENPVKAGYLFEGWYLGENKVDLSTYVPTASVTLNARFSQEPAVTAVADKTEILKDGTATITATAFNFSGAVSYTAIISDDTVISATNVNNVFTVTGLKDGSATIAIKATYNTEEATSEPITINVGYVIPADATAIGTKSELLAYFNKSAENTNKNAYLTADIDMGGEAINDIRMAGDYNAIFEGCGHSITNFSATRPFFNIISASGEVRNVSFSLTWGNASGFGCVSYSNNGTMKNVDVEVTLSAAINTWAPLAIAGDGTYINCDTIIHGEAAAGSNTLGAVARGGSTTFTNCTCHYKGIDTNQFQDKDNVTLIEII